MRKDVNGAMEITLPIVIAHGHSKVIHNALLPTLHFNEIKMSKCKRLHERVAPSLFGKLNEEVSERSQ